MARELRTRQSRRWIAPAVTVLALAVTTTGLAGVRAPDRNPPTFSGLKSATTCVAGPVAGQSASYRLEWDPATDDVTPAKKLTYDIYQATKAGGEDFSAPTYTVGHGATTFTTRPLPADTSFYFVVRAKDRAGNEDSNDVEREGVNICD